MKKLNFNQLKSVKTPENWIESAINIPQKNKKKPVYLNIYLIASAACFVFCCALCAVIFSNFGVDVPAPIASQKSTTSANSKTIDESTLPSIPSIISTLPNSIAEAIESAIQKNTDIPDSVVTKPSSSSSLNNIDSYTKPSSSSTINSTEKYTKPTKPATEPPEPTNSPVIPDTQPVPTEGPAIVDSTTEQQTTAPIAEPSYYYIESIYFDAKANNSSFAFGNDIYCHIESKSGQSYSLMYSSKEKTTVKSTSSGLSASFNPFEKNIFLPKGEYYVKFYDKYGHSVQKLVHLGDNSVCIYE